MLLTFDLHRWKTAIPFLIRANTIQHRCCRYLKGGARVVLNETSHFEQTNFVKSVEAVYKRQIFHVEGKRYFMKNCFASPHRRNFDTSDRDKCLNGTKKRV